MSGRRRASSTTTPSEKSSRGTRSRRGSTVGDSPANVKIEAPPSPASNRPSARESAPDEKRLLNSPGLWQAITPEGLKVLDSYKYAGTDLSLLGEFFFFKFWNWLVTFLPTWLAPNLVTTIGFLFLLANFFVGIYFCAAGVKCVMPAWYYFMVAFNIFVYQTMDNLDGKQARRTRSSSVLGELFDHGCDSLFLLLTSVPLAIAIGIDATFGTYMYLAGILVFFTAHWEEFHSHHLVLGYVANPTEGQIAIIILFLLAGFKGPAYFSTPVTTILPGFVTSLVSRLVSLQGVSLLDVIRWGTPAACLAATLFNIVEVFYLSRRRRESFLAALQPLFPALVLVASGAAWVRYSPIGIAVKETVLFWTLFGLVGSFITNRIMVARVTRMDFPWWDNVLLLVVLPTVNALYPVLSGNASIVSEVLVLKIATAAAGLVLVYYIVSVVNLLANYLGISVFTLSHLKK